MFNRLSFASVLFAASAFAAGPQLTTIQDVLYKADGTRFNGVLTISWDSFQAGDNTQVVSQSTTVKVANGYLYVQLAPSSTATPAFTYAVKYNSDGRVQFTETWSVPSSAQPLRVKDVRIDTSASTETSGSTVANTTSVNESDVTGLIADLSARPMKGPAFAPGRVAFVNPGGSIDSVSGDPSDCVRVDGSTGPCGSTSQPPGFIDGDLPAGLVDGSNTVFTLSNIPSPAASLAVYRNGLLQKIGQDYTLDSSTLTFVAAATPQPGDTLLASYRVDSGGATGAAPFYPAPQVVCSGTGASLTATTMSSAGVCNIPAGLLAAGDHLAIHLDLEHTGTASGFSFQVLWGSTTVLSRTASASDALVTARADASVVTAGARFGHQSWGTSLPFAAGVVSAPDAWSAGVTIDFQGMLAQAGDTLKLAGFAVVRLP